MDEGIEAKKVSIIMPVYNAKKSLEKSVGSVINQSYNDFELILIDDGSTDGSGALCDDLALHEDRIRVIHQNNRGISSARNMGIRLAMGKYLTFIDDDDCYMTDFLKRMVDTLENYDVELVKCGRKNIKINKNGKIKYVINNIPPNMFIDNGLLLRERFNKLKSYGVMGSVWNGLYITDIIINNKIKFDENFKYGNEDLLFNVNYLRCINRFCFCEDILYKHYIWLGDSTSSFFNQQQVFDHITVMISEINYIAEGLGDIYNTDQIICLLQGLVECFDIISKHKYNKDIRRLYCVVKEKFNNLLPLIKLRDMANVGIKKAVVLELFKFDLYYVIHALFRINETCKIILFKLKDLMIGEVENE